MHGDVKLPDDVSTVRPSMAGLTCLFLAVFVPLLLNGFYNIIITRMPVVYWAVELVVWVLLPSLGLYAYRRMGGRFRDLGVVWPRSVGEVCKVLLYGCGWGLVLFWAFRSGRSWGESVFDKNYLVVAFDYGSLIPDSGWPKTAVWIYLSLSAGIVEELYFRGFLRRFFARGRLGSVYFMGASTVLFSAIHWENGVNDLLATAAFGFLACICYLSHRSILVPMIAHVVADLILFH